MKRNQNTQIIQSSEGKTKPEHPHPQNPNTAAEPDKNPDFSIPKPGGNEPEKVDPTIIEEPSKTYAFCNNRPVFYFSCCIKK